MQETKPIPTKFDGIFRIGDHFATVNLTPGKKVYGEELVQIGKVEYRIWDKWRSKPSAALSKGLKIFPLAKGQKILYLGVGSGTTCSHYSDIVGEKGFIYGIDISERPIRDLLDVAKARKNIAPILADCRRPETYSSLITERVDLVYEDIADPDQIKILIRNCESFLKPAGYAMIAIKSQSIDVLKPPKQVYKECLQELEKHFEILDKVTLDPYEKFHLFVVMRKVTSK